MRKVLVTSTLLFLCGMAACSPRDFLTRRLAADLIAASPLFTAPQQFWLRTGIIGNKDFTSPESLVLQRHGWITGASAACSPGLAPPPCWNLTLTPLGIDTIRGIASGSSGNANYFSIPTARRELVGVTGISRSGNVADVEFLWKWTAMNEIGAALYAGGVQYSSTVGFKKYDDGWRLAATDPARSYQSITDALKNAEPTQ